MTIKKLSFFLLLMISLFIMGCGDSCGSTQHGFTVETVVRNFQGQFSPNPNVNVSGFVLVNPAPTQGTTNFNQTTGPDATTFVQDGVVGVDWYFTQLQIDHQSVPCPPQTQRVSTDGQTVVLDCPSGATQFTVAPSDVEYPYPGALQVTGTGISNTYGAPPVTFYDEAGNVVAQTTGSNVSPDGTSVTVQSPDFSSFASGYYLVAVYNVAADGTWEKAGGGYIQVYGYEPPPPPPDDGCQPAPERGPAPECGIGTS